MEDNKKNNSNLENEKQVNVKESEYDKVVKKLDEMYAEQQEKQRNLNKSNTNYIRTSPLLDKERLLGELEILRNSNNSNNNSFKFIIVLLAICSVAFIPFFCYFYYEVKSKSDSGMLFAIVAFPIALVLLVFYFFLIVRLFELVRLFKSSSNKESKKKNEVISSGLLDERQYNLIMNPTVNNNIYLTDSDLFYYKDGLICEPLVRKISQLKRNCDDNFIKDVVAIVFMVVTCILLFFVSDYYFYTVLILFVFSVFCSVIFLIQFLSNKKYYNNIVKKYNLPDGVFEFEEAGFDTVTGMRIYRIHNSIND